MALRPPSCGKSQATQRPQGLPRPHPGAPTRPRRSPRMAPASQVSPEEASDTPPPPCPRAPPSEFTLSLIAQGRHSPVCRGRRDTSWLSILSTVIHRGVLVSFERGEMHKSQSADAGTGGPGLSRPGARGPPFSRTTALPTLTERLRTLPRSQAQGRGTATARDTEHLDARTRRSLSKPCAPGGPVLDHPRE